MTNFEKVREFMETFGQEVLDKPYLSTINTQDLRYELIREELQEFSEALDKEDVVGVADALTDLLYVVYGAGCAFGIDLDACFNEVHRSNMSKLGEDGAPIYREDGKVMKGPYYFPPDIKKVIGV